ncbi:MAG: VOC family protein [Candidatus Hydrogenedentes bacterium]|nr:VOC family protein [Candidatus Hydrogenedentota bacterium]
MGIISGRLDHVALQVADLERALAFYTGVLGLKLQFRKRDEAHGEAFAFLELEGGNLELLQLLGAEDGAERAAPREPWCPHVALAAEDVDTAIAAVRAAGATVLKGPLEIAGLVRWAYIADPDNNVIEFVQWLGAEDTE